MSSMMFAGVGLTANAQQASKDTKPTVSIMTTQGNIKKITTYRESASNEKILQTSEENTANNTETEMSYMKLKSGQQIISLTEKNHNNDTDKKSRMVEFNSKMTIFTFSGFSKKPIEFSKEINLDGVSETNFKNAQEAANYDAAIKEGFDPEKNIQQLLLAREELLKKEKNREAAYKINADNSESVVNPRKPAPGN